MFPRRQLIRLEAEKSLLRARIALRRAELTETAVVVARPLVWIDRARALWTRVAPILREVAPMFSARAREGADGRNGGLWRWLPAIAAAWRAFRSRDPSRAPP